MFIGFLRVLERPASATLLFLLVGLFSATPLLAASAASTSKFEKGNGLVKIADRINYPLTVLESGATETDGHVIYRPGASFIKLHFSKFVLPRDVSVEISNPDRSEVYTYSRYKRSPYTFAAEEGEDGRRSFSTMSISGDIAVIRILGKKGNLKNRLHKLEVDYLMEGYPEAAIEELLKLPANFPGDAGLQSSLFNDFDARPESTCGIAERDDLACVASQYPVEAERSRPVARLLINGGSLCTGWRVGASNRLFTNNHCVDSGTDVRNTEVWFNYQRSSCGGSLANTVKVAGADMLDTDAELDYTLMTLSNFNSIAGFGHFGLEVREPVLGDRIYIPQHGGGNPKELAVESDQNASGWCEIDDASANGRGPDTDTGYFCDTAGGSSGSPVVAADTNRVLALHHWGGCTNQGVKMSEIWPQVAIYFDNQIPTGDNEPPADEPDPDPNSAPVAEFSANCFGMDCLFDASSSYDSDGSIVSYHWDFGDGTSGTGVSPRHSYPAGGNFSAVLTVTDDGNLAANYSQTVVAIDPDTLGIQLSLTYYKVQGEKNVDLSWSGANGNQVDIYRAGSLLTTTANDGFFNDQPSFSGRQKTVSYKVCEAGTDVCSRQTTTRLR